MLTRDRPSNRDPHRGFGYVEFSLAEDALSAIDNMDQSELYGRVIKVNQAKPQKNADEGLGSRTAVWEQEGYASKYNVNEEDGLDAEANGRPDDPVSCLPCHRCFFCLFSNEVERIR
jgi:RNA recognition motif-containing protein